MDVEDGIGRRMVILRRYPVWLDPKGPYSTPTRQHLRLMPYELLYVTFMSDF
jgi:hypothetical protein